MLKNLNGYSYVAVDSLIFIFSEPGDEYNHYARAEHRVKYPRNSGNRPVGAGRYLKNDLFGLDEDVQYASCNNHNARAQTPVAYVTKPALNNLEWKDVVNIGYSYSGFIPSGLYLEWFEDGKKNEITFSISVKQAREIYNNISPFKILIDKN